MKKISVFIPLVIIALWACSFTTKEDSTKIIEQSQKSMDTFVVGLYPLGMFDKELLKLLKEEVQSFYKCKVLVLEGSDLPKNTFYPARNRYRADSLLDYLLQVCPQKINSIVGLTQKDISCTNGKYPDWGVFGLGYMPGKSCVISTHRLHIGEKSIAHFQERFFKVVIHEIGHNFGLEHCPNPNCIMRDAEGTIKSVDHEKKALCEDCRKKLEKKQKRII